jgi:ATP-binding cassette subfamily B (MDR/TAP) protein 1
MSRPAHDGSHHSDHKTPSNKGSESNVCSVDTSDISTVVPPGRSTWRSLFAFTKWSHAALLAAAIAAAGVAAALKTVLAVVLGQIFDVIGAFGNGIQSGTTTVAEVARWAVILVMLGIGNWAANSAFVALWVAFGELQANSVRNEVFQSLLSRNIAWFDEQEQGISSLLVRIET